jgi:hypothetical protein
MNRIISIFLLLFLLNSSFCLAQQSDSLLLPSMDSSIVIEKVYLHNDRDFYSQGDNIWFKAYLVEDPDLFLSDNSMNLHVELIASQSEIIDSRIIRIEGGLVKGSIELSDTLSPGVYIIRAYTNYMRNFADMQIFEKTLMKFMLSDKIHLGEVKIVARRNKASSVNYVTQTAYAVQMVAVGIPDQTIKINTQDERFTNFRDIIRKGVSGVRVESSDAVPRIFYSPDYSSISTPSMPDLRSRLLWNPDITVNDNGTIDYYNADNKGNIMITVEGSTSDGIPVTGKLEYKVE